MKKLISLKLLIAFSINLIAPVTYCGKNQKFRQNSGYAKQYNKFYPQKITTKEKRRKNKQAKQKEELSKKNKERNKLLQILHKNQKFKNFEINTIPCSSNINIPWTFIRLMILAFFTKTASANFGGSSYDIVVTGARTEFTKWICFDEPTVLYCPPPIKFETPVCVSGVYDYTISKGSILKAEGIAVCGCNQFGDLNCIGTGLKDPMAYPDPTLVSYNKNEKAPTVLKTISQISSIATNGLIIGIPTVGVIGAAATALTLYCKYKKAHKKTLRQASVFAKASTNRQDDREHSHYTSSVTFHEIPNKSKENEKITSESDTNYTETDLSNLNESTESESDTDTESSLSSVSSDK